MMRFRELALGVTLCALAGCATRTVGVNAYYRPSGQGTLADSMNVYVIKNEAAESPTIDAQIASRLQSELTRGPTSVPSFDEANFYLVYGYDLGRGYTVSQTIPVRHKGKTVNVSTWGYGSGGLEYSSSRVKLPDTTEYVEKVSTRYESELRLRLLDGPALREEGRELVVWSAEATDTHRRADPTVVATYLARAAMDRFGTSTGRRITVGFANDGHIMTADEWEQVEAARNLGAAVLVVGTVYLVYKYIEAGGDPNDLDLSFLSD